MLTLIVALSVFSVLIIIHEMGHLIAAKKIGVDVETFSLGFGKRLWGIKIGGTDYRISMLPLGGYVKMAGEDPSEVKGEEGELASKPVGKRFWVMAAGALTNYVFAFILFSFIFMVGVPTLSNEVGDVLKDFPAQKAGLKVGDTILSINDGKVEYWDDIVRLIAEGTAAKGSLDVVIDRAGKTMSLHIVPEVSTVKNVFGQTISRPLIGVSPKEKILSVKYPPLAAIREGGRRLIIQTGMTYKGIWLLITGGMPVKGTVSGPIGIARMMGQAASIGIVPLLVLTAHISMALAVFNLLPFPVLDGGHIIFLGLEKLRGKPLSAKLQDNITQVAFYILLSFVVFVSWQDIVKILPFGGK